MEFCFNRTVPSAGTAVDFFFVLSGFVLAAAYRRPGWEYVTARVVRLYPMVLLGVALGAVLLLSTGMAGDWPPALAFNLAGLPLPGVGYVFDHPLWSIAVEAELSVLFILAARLPTALLVICVLALAAVASPTPSFGGLSALIRGALPFFTGVLIQRVGDRIPTGRFAVPLACLGLALALVLPTGHAPALEALFFAAIVAAGLSPPPAEIQAPMTYLGRLSYPVYALHWPIGWWAANHQLFGRWGSLPCLRRRSLQRTSR
jgi:peptidoglycan/LPS O-acetylase OafA/YrhL